MHHVVFAIVTMIGIFLSGTAFAVPVQWTLSGVTFDDGGTATGSFVYDADIDAYSNISIITTAGTSFAGATYTFIRLLKKLVASAAAG